MLLDADKFAHYGTDETLLSQGAWAEVNSVILETYSGVPVVRINENVGRLRKVFNRATPMEEGGVAFRFLIEDLPSDSDSLALAIFRDSDNWAVITLAVSSTGQVVLWSSSVDEGAILASSAPEVSTGSFQHFECNCVFEDGTGAVEVRLNGVTVLNATGVSTRTHWTPFGDSTSLPAQVALGRASGTSTGGVDIRITDYMERDAEGYQNTTFVGEKSLVLVVPNGDTAQEDWIPSTGSSSFAMVDNIPPNDAQFLAGANDGDRTDLALENLGGTVVSIVGVVVKSRQWKTDAGTATTAIGMVSGGDEEQSATRALTTAPTYYTDVFETDPDTGALWTPSGFNAADLSLTRID